jgi:50S ribosome-binding GTPase/Domain of unknown function (DUF3482)
MTDIALSLVSHTNVGKTTLARTLLQRDVGEVRDAPHVTEFADQHLLIESPEGDRLLLWDTPGFGDSVRLLKRLRSASNPVGWFLSEVWDRWRDRAFWASQQALRHVRDDSSVVLYLVNAAEPQAGYLAPEMELLAWMNKPVLVLLNQLGEPRDTATEQAEVQQWREQLARWPGVHDVLSLDAFARCWVHEQTLLAAVQSALAAPAARTATGANGANGVNGVNGVSVANAANVATGSNGAGDSGRAGSAGTLGNRAAEGAAAAAMAYLRAAWQVRQQHNLEAAMQALAASLARLALARETVEPGAGALAGLGGRLRDLGTRIKGDTDKGPQAEAAQRLEGRVQEELRVSTAQLLHLHGLDGAGATSSAAERVDEVLSRVAAQVQAQRHVPEGEAAFVGGALTGALVGLKADIATGGLTLGGGMLAGAILGALGGAGVARGINRVRGVDSTSVMLAEQALWAASEAAVLRYLAVAHFGRGRGGWVRGEAPAHWALAVREVLEPLRADFAATWQFRAEKEQPTSNADGLQAALAPLFSKVVQQVLARLYPPHPSLNDPISGPPDSPQKGPLNGPLRA